MSIPKIILIVVLSILAFILYIFITNLLDSLTRYFNSRADLYKTEKAKVEHEMTTSTVSLIDRMEGTLQFLNVCNTLIDVEINNIMRTITRLNQKYDMKRLDDDVKLIATKVYKSVKSDVFINKDMVLQPDYIMQHITDETVLRLLKYTQAYNIKLSSNLPQN